MDRCVDCGEIVDPLAPLMLVEVIGWAKRRLQGGQNHVIERRETGRVLCGDCGNRKVLGLSTKQRELF